MKKSVYRLVLLSMILLLASGCGGGVSDDDDFGSLPDFGVGGPSFYGITANILVVDQSGEPIPNVYPVIYCNIERENCESIMDSHTSYYPANGEVPSLLYTGIESCGTAVGICTILVDVPGYAPAYTDISFTWTRSEYWVETDFTWTQSEIWAWTIETDLYFTLEPEGKQSS